MYSEKLLSLLRTLSKVELNRLRKMVCSPWFNEEPEVLQLFDLFNEALRKGDDAVAALDKPTVWEKLYPGKKMDDAQLRRLASDLTQLVLRFLLEEVRIKNPLTEALEMQKVLESPVYKKHLSGVERNIQKLLDDDPRKSPEHYLAQFKMHWNIFSRSAKRFSTVDYLDKLFPAAEHLDIFYLVQKMQVYLAWLMFQKVRVADREMPMMPGFWEHLDNPRYQAVPLVAIYKNLIRCMSEPGEESYFQTLLDDLERYAADLTKEELRECYHIAQNYCALKVNQGRTDYFPIFFRLFKSIVHLGILLENGQLSEGVFKNMVTISVNVGEFGWAEDFIQEYAAHLPSHIRENARTFNLAYLYSYQKRHQEVIGLLRNVEYSDVVYSLGSKMLLLRTYYELDELMAMDSLMDSFRIYVRRNKLISKELKREYINFLHFLKKLSALSIGTPQAIAAVKKKVAASKNKTTKKWLLEKIEELER